MPLSYAYGPVTKRLFDPNDRWPRFISLFQGRDDENYISKTMYLARYTTVGTGFLSMWDIVLMPHKGGIPTALARIKWWSIPFIGGGLAYTTTLNAVANIRGGKNDQYNHLFAGLSVGAVLGKHAKSIQLGILSGLFIGVFAVICKDSVLHDYVLFPERQRHKRLGNAMSHKYDFSMKPDRAGYWVRSEAEVPAMLARGQV